MVSVDADAIPDELKERDQWLLWDEKADDKKPRTVSNGRMHKASWTTPSQWLSFDEALEVAQSREGCGIGYVFAKGHLGDDEPDRYPRGIYGALDLDGCVNEEGSPKEWLPSLEPFFDAGAFVEYSPSGEGIHIPIVGFEEPEWWTDSAIAEHEGVEAYDKKFFTFTGDTLRGSGETAAEMGDYVIDWLKEAYESINGERPWEDDEPEKEVSAPSSSTGSTGNAEEIARAVNDLDARDVAEKTIVSDWNDDAGTSGDNRAFYPTWGPNCNGTANIVDEDGWTDTGTDSGSGGPLEMAAIDMGELRHSGCSWGDVTGDLWWDAVDHLRDLGFRIPEYEKPAKSPEPPTHSEKDSDDEESGADVGEWWTYAREVYEAETNKEGRATAADALEKTTDWMYVMDSDILWVYAGEQGYFKPWGEQTAHRILEHELGTHYSQTEAKEIIGRIEARNQTRRKALNARTRDSPLLCVGNGVVNLETGELSDHSPDYKFTRGLSWDYEPATADPEPIVEFLDDVTKREADRDTILDHLAHGLMPGHPYRAFVMMYGPGSNGKTRVGKLLRGFVGEDNAASVELQDLTGDDSFATGGLPGAFVNVGDDISVGEVRETSILKSLTGDGTVRANEKYEKQYEFENEAAMFFSANEPPRFREKTDAVSDRLYPIEMPNRFVDDPDPNNPNEKKKIPGVAENLLGDEAAMRGLLLLAVKHAQDVIDRKGQYSMPEGPQERREMYEAASDPIKRFALDQMVGSDSSGVILKDDAYTVYTEMCEAEGERAASADVFKQKVGQLVSIDLESTRTRKLTPGDSRENAWRYVEFAETAKDLMPSRLVERYFSEEAVAESDDDGDGEGDETPAFGARPVARVAEDPTGYATVTVDVLKVEQPDADNAPAVRATVKDESSAIDVISWDDPNALVEGQTVVIENAKVAEYNGTSQLAIEDAVTAVQTIQSGVGNTTPDSPDPGQNTVDAATDGGVPAGADEIENVKGRVHKLISDTCVSGDEVTAARVAGELARDVPPDQVEGALDRLAERDGVLERDGDGGYTVL